uniref:GDSL esterase/lipase n=1 Tax=Setaria italica TaxID=4555 RepID=K3Z7D1_SETIT
MATPAAVESSSATAVARALLVVLAAAALCSSAAAGEPELIISAGRSIARRHAVPAVYVFGGSLVDAGNNDFLPPPAPRAVPPNGVDLPRTVLRRTGRFTNGYNLADIIAQHVGFKKSPPAYLSLMPLSSFHLLRGRVGTNFASGGSGILNATVQLFAKTKATIIRAGLVGRERLDSLLARSLFLISTGGNDFAAFGHGGGVPMSQAPEFIAGMVTDYLSYINRAITANGECNDVGNYLSELFNSLLRAEMAKAVAASMPGMKYSIASLYNVFSDMIANPTLAGLREVKRGCCGSGKFNGEVDCTMGTSLCTDRGKYLFWDKVHGTQAAYRWAVLAFFHGTMRDAEPINLDQLLMAPYSSM